MGRTSPAAAAATPHPPAPPPPPAAGGGAPSSSSPPSSPPVGDAATTAAAAAAAAAPLLPHRPPLEPFRDGRHLADYFCAAVERDAVALDRQEMGGDWEEEVPAWWSEGGGDDALYAPAAAAAAASAAAAPAADAAGCRAEWLDPPVGDAADAGCVKGDGPVRYMLADDMLHVLAAADGGATAVNVASLMVEWSSGMLVDGPALLLIGCPSHDAVGPAANCATTCLTRVDASRPAAPVVTSTVQVVGQVVGARSDGGGDARLTIVSPLDAPLHALPDYNGRHNLRAAGRVAHLRAAAAAASPDDWLPTYTCTTPDAGRGVPTVTSGPLVAATRTYYQPEAYAGCTLTTVLSLPIAEPADDDDRKGAVGRGDPARRAFAVVSGGHGGDFAVASTATTWACTLTLAPNRVGGGSAAAAAATTDVHVFDTTDGGGRYVASATVPGQVLEGSSALHERDGVLYVATSTPTPTPTPTPTSAAAAAATASSAAAVTAWSATLTALTVGAHALTTWSMPLGCGDGSSVIAVRHVEDGRAVAVTGRSVWMLDLRDPSRVVPSGVIRLPGSVHALYPLEPGLLLCLGHVRSGRGRRDDASTAYAVCLSVTDGGPAGGPPSSVATWSPPPSLLSAAGVADGAVEAVSHWGVSADPTAVLFDPARRLVIAPLVGGHRRPFVDPTSAVALRVGVAVASQDGGGLDGDRAAGGLSAVAGLAGGTAARSDGMRTEPIGHALAMGVGGRYLWTLAHGEVEVRDLDGEPAFHVTCRTELMLGN